MVYPLSRYASSPSRETTPTAWQSQFRGVHWLGVPVHLSNILEN
jgi:hypothetical protein